MMAFEVTHLLRKRRSPAIKGADTSPASRARSGTLGKSLSP